MGSVTKFAPRSLPSAAVYGFSSARIFAKKLIDPEVSIDVLLGSSTLFSQNVLFETIPPPSEYIAPASSALLFANVELSMSTAPAINAPP